MRLGLFIVVFAALLAVLALAAPLQIGPRAPNNELPPLQSAAQCLQLSYPAGGGDYLPTLIRLESTYAPFVAPRGSWYLARANTWSEAGWRPWGADSIDISSYHGPRVRLPRRGERAVGEVVLTGAVPLLAAIFRERRPVRAVRVECSAVVSEPPNDR